MKAAANPTAAPAPLWPSVLVAFAIAAAVYALKALLNLETVPLLADTDDAMRLTVVRDLLAGQGWYDPVQHRLNTPFGAELHWSRLVDLPLAGLMLALRPLLGPLADTVLLFVWPLLLLFALLGLTCLITLRLVGREGLLPALVLPTLSLATFAEFVPGRIDHHGVQILLALLLLHCSIEALRRPLFAAFAGLVAATALAIGVESLPQVLAATLALGLAWVLRPELAASLRNFGLAFGLGALAHGVLALPPERWALPACDALSIVYVAAALAVGVAFLVLSLLPLAPRPALWRLGAGALAGAAVLGAWALAFPACLAGPYAGVDPWLMQRWIAHIKEAQPLWESLRERPVYAVSVTIPVLLSCAVALFRAVRVGADRAPWLLYAFYLAVAAVVMLVQVRGARLALELVTPAAAWLIVAARRRFLAAPRLVPVLALAGSWVVFSGIVLGLLVTLVALAVPGHAAAQDPAGQQQRQRCLLDSAFTGLAERPPQRIMSFIDLGAHLLAHTPHAVVAAPYHRNGQGVRDAFAFFNDPLEDGRAILSARGIDLVVICPAMPEAAGLSDAAAESFLALRRKAALPPWLVRRDSGEGPLEIYEVVEP